MNDSQPSRPRRLQIGDQHADDRRYWNGHDWVKVQPARDRWYELTEIRPADPELADALLVLMQHFPEATARMERNR
jgi:hypothetical protein